MSKVCQISGKRSRVGNRVSHAKNRSKRRFKPNLISKRIWDPKQKRWVRMRIAAKTLRTLDKKGALSL